MLDTGANQNCVSSNFCTNHNITFLESISYAKGFNGTIEKSCGQVYLDLVFPAFTVSHVLFNVYTNCSYPIIVSGSIFKTVKIRYPDLLNNQLKIFLNGHDVPCLYGSDLTICSHTTLFVPSRSLRYYQLEVPNMVPDLSYVCTPKSDSDVPGLKILPVVCRNIFYLQVENPHFYDMEIPKNIILYKAQPQSSINALVHIGDEEAENERLRAHNEWRVKTFDVLSAQIKVPFGPSIENNPERVKMLTKIINDRKMAFSTSTYDLGLIKSYRYQMKLKPDYKTWFQPPRKISPVAQQEVTAIFKDEVKYKLIREAPSTFSVPLVLVKKASGQYRICHDLRECNKNIIVERFPLPEIGSLLNQISSAISRANPDQEIFISKYDLRGAYRQLGIVQEDWDKFAFVSGNRMYQTLRMPFGAADSPSSWQELMATEWNKPGMENVYCYLDDIIRVTIGFPQLLTDTIAMLDNSIACGMTMSPDKCLIGGLEADVLGFKITQRGIALNHNKVEKLTELKRPCSKDQVRSVLGSFNFYREFAPSLIRTLQPLYELLKKNITFKWGKSEQDAFQDAKKLIANYVERVHRNPKLDLVLTCDASNTGAGGVLHQRKENGQLEPLSFYSRNFSDTEKRFPIRTRELLAIYFSIKNFEALLLCAKFYVHSDHRSLIFFQNTKCNTLTTRIYNVLNYLARFEFKMVYMPGKSPSMLPADLMSRADSFCPVPPDNGDDEIPDADDMRTFKINSVHKYNFFPFSIKYILEWQQKDVKLKNILAKIKKTILY